MTEDKAGGAEALERLRSALRAFADERDWEQFHSPKNLAMALSVEAAELLEIFQWLGEDASRKPGKEVLERAGEEMADVLLYLVSLADKLDVDLIQAAERKLRVNAEKYPVEKARGNSIKYNRF